MGFFDIFSTSKAMDTASDVVKSGVTMLDEAFYTEQERATFKAKAVDQWLEIQKVVATQSTPTSVSRRIVACIVLIPSMIMALIATLLVVFSDGHAEKVAAMQGIATAWGLPWAMGAVVVFYFGDHLAKRFARQ